MKITIVGQGKIADFLATSLTKSRAKHDLRILNIGEQKTKTVSKIPGSDKSDLVIVAVKSYDTELAINSIKPLLGDETKVLTIQNGVGNLEMINEVVTEDRALGGVLWPEQAVIGRPDGKMFGDLRIIANTFNEAKIKTRMSKDIKSVIWSQLVINVGIDALSAITRLRNGQLIKSEGTKEILRQAVSEAVKVAKRKGVKLLYDDPLQKVESICAATSSDISNMLEDILNKRKTEIDSLNGAISRHGRSAGQKTPMNDMLSAIVKTIEATYDKQIEKC